MSLFRAFESNVGAVTSKAFIVANCVGSLTFTARGETTVEEVVLLPGLESRLPFTGTQPANPTPSTRPTVHDTEVTSLNGEGRIIENPLGLLKLYGDD